MGRNSDISDIRCEAHNSDIRCALRVRSDISDIPGISCMLSVTLLNPDIADTADIRCALRVRSDISDIRCALRVRSDISDIRCARSVVAGQSGHCGTYLFSFGVSYFVPIFGVDTNGTVL